MQYDKRENKLVVEAPERVIPGETREYTLNYLKAQERAILAQIERHTQKFQSDLDEVRNLIDEAEKLGIKEEVYKDELTRE